MNPRVGRAEADAGPVQGQFPGSLGHSDHCFYLQPRWSPKPISQPGAAGVWGGCTSYTKGSRIQRFPHLFSQINVFTISKHFSPALSSRVHQERCRGLAPREGGRRDMEGEMLPTSPSPCEGGHPSVHHLRPHLRQPTQNSHSPLEQHPGPFLTHVFQIHEKFPLVSPSTNPGQTSEPHI